MIVRQLSPIQYDRLHQDLIQKAQTQPLKASYTVHMCVDGASYAVKIQPESRYRMAVLQAHRIFREEDGQEFELITQNVILSALLELLIYQGVSAS